MAYTTSDLVSDVQSRISNSSFSSSDIKQFLNDAQRSFATDATWRFFHTTQNYTLNVGTADITNGSGLPSAFQTPNKLRITTSGYEQVLTPIQYDEFVEKYPSYENDDNSTPRYWYMKGDSIEVYPAPDTAFTVKLEYWKTPTELSADSDVPELPVDFREVLVLGALQRAYKTDDDFDQAREIDDEMVALLTNLKRKYSFIPGQKQMGINRASIKQR